MSSKFTRNSPVQAPPPVCRKPPDTPIMPIPPIDQRILIAYAKIKDGVWTPPFDVTVYFHLHPTGMPNRWAGISDVNGDHARIETEFIPATNTINLLLQAMRGPVPLTSDIFNDVPVVSLYPFSTNLIHKLPRGAWDVHEVQIYQ